MKRIALALLLAALTLAGCSLNPFRHKAPAYETAQQERPLEVPPGMDQPPTSEALVIPNAGSGTASTTTAAAASPAVAAPPAAGTMAAAPPAAGGGTGLTLADTPDSAYHRVGLALERGEVGKVTAHDDTAHTYLVAVDTVVTEKPEGGFFHRMFHHAQNETVTGNVTVSVAPQGSGSVIDATGNPDAVARVMGLLRQRLGGG